METNLPSRSEGPLSIRIFGVGDTGINVTDLLIADGISPDRCVVVNVDGGSALLSCPASTRVRLESKRLRGLGSGGDPDRGRQSAEAQIDLLIDNSEKVVFGNLIL